MDPGNRRSVKKARLLSALRSAPASASALSESLGISAEEVMSILREEDAVEEKDGLFSIRGDAGRVFSAELRRGSLALALSDLSGRTLRYERLPRKEGWESLLMSTVEKMKADGKVYGGVVSSSAKEDMPALEGFPVLYLPPSVIEARSELMHRGPLPGCLFISWSESFDASFMTARGLQHLPTFGHIRAAREGKCQCGATGCLDAVASVRFLRERTGEWSTKALYKETPALKAALNALSYAIAVSAQVLGAESVVITGDMSQLPDTAYSYMEERLRASLPPGRSVPVRRSMAGDKGSQEGAAASALDAFFYHTELLGQLSAIESHSWL